MTQLERFRATVAHQKTDGVLARAMFSPGLERQLRTACDLSENVNLQDHFGLFAPTVLAPRPPDNAAPADFSCYFEGVERPAGTTVDSLGVLHIPGSEHHFTRYVSPLRNAMNFEEIECFPYPELPEDSKDHMAEAVAHAHARGRVAAGMVGHIFEDAWQIRGMEAFLTDMVARPEWCEYILDQLTVRNLRRACMAAEAGVDYLHTGDDVATQHSMMFSVALWRRFLKPRWAEIYAEARSIKPDLEIWYHSDGDIAPIIPELVEIGVTILNPLQPECMLPEKVKSQYGRWLVLDGTVGTQTTMPFGTPSEVRRLVRSRIEDLGQDGALILSPTHVLEPDVPVENVLAFIQESTR